MTGAEDRAALTDLLAAAISYCEREIASLNAAVRLLEKAERQRIENAYDEDERWRGLDSFMVALATDGLTRLFGIPGTTASAVRRLGMAGVDRLPPLKRWFMDEARGMAGDLPELLRA